MRAASVSAEVSASQVWLMAARPATLPAAVAPVLVGLGAALHQRDFRPLAFVATLVAALLLQVGTNLANDVSDFERGADARGRLGPPRVTQSGLATPVQVRLAMLGVFAAAALIGVYLATVGGWPIIAIGAASIVAGLAYTGGPWPYGYHALGDAFVFVFFGLVAVTGTAYLKSDEWTGLALAASLPMACTVTAILVVNNLRDIETDRRAGKRTLAVALGAPLTRAEYALLMLASYALVAALTIAGVLPWAAWLAWLTLPVALALVRRVAGGAAGPGLNIVLRRTSQLHLALGVLLAIGLAL